MRDEFAAQGIQVETIITNQVDLQLFLREASTQTQAIVLVIDEFENIPEMVVDELMHTFRAMYQKRQYHKLQALALVGISTIAELILTSASPFNVVDELRIPYFTLAEVEGLISQHVAETGQPFAEEVISYLRQHQRATRASLCALSLFSDDDGAWP